MALTLDTRFETPLAWSDINDAFPGPTEWAGYFDSINDLAAQDTQGVRVDRPAAAPGRTGGAQGGYYWATNGTAGGAAKSLSRSDGGAWWEIALLGARADFVAGVTVAADGSAEATHAYAPLGVTRDDAAGDAFVAFNRSGRSVRPALGVEAATDAILFGAADNTAHMAAVAALRTTGELDAVGADHRFGASARGASGTQVHLGSRGDAANAYVGAEGSASIVGLILRGQGSTGAVTVQPDASTTAATFTATAVTLAKATTITAGGLAVTGGITAATGDIAASAGAVKVVGPGGTPRLYLKSTDSATDAKVWDLYANGNTLVARAINDAENAAATWLTVTRAAAAISSVALAAFTTITAGGLSVVGSPTGYTDELKFASSSSGANAGITAFGTGAAQMLFDHRGAAGSWLWRNGVGAVNQQASLSATGTFAVAGDLQIPQLKSLKDTTSGGRLLYHDASNVYAGSVDSGDSRGLILRANGTDVAKVDPAGYLYAALAPGTTHESVRLAGVAQVSARGFAVNADGAAFQGGSTVGVSVAISRAAPALTLNNAGGALAAFYVGSTPKLLVDSVGQLAVAGVTANLGAGALGATGGVLSVYADTGASDVWLYARAQDLATYRNLELRALNTRFWDTGGVLQAKIGAESDLFALDTNLWTRWADSGSVQALTQVRLATGLSIRNGTADSLYFLRVI